MNKKVTLKYIGKEPTLVRAGNTAPKQEIKSGETFEVDERLAKNYLRAYSHLFVDLGGGESKDSAEKKEKKAEFRAKKKKFDKKGSGK